MSQPEASRRLFVSNVSEQGTDLVLTGPSRRYVRDVLRMGPGDGLLLFDGSGMEYPSTIVEANARKVSVRILGSRPGTRESPVQTQLGIGLLKANKMDLVVQKVSELGGRQIFPIAVRRVVPALGPDRADQRRERWQKIAREASRQSGRTTVAEVCPVVSLEGFLERSDGADLALIFSATESRPLMALHQERALRPRTVAMLVGPEGGFSAEEEQSAREAGFHPVGLGPRVLRAETAAIVAMGLVQYAFGDLGGYC